MKNLKQLVVLTVCCCSISCFKSPKANSSTSSASNSFTSVSPERTSSTPGDSSGSEYSKALEAYNAKKYDDASKGFEAVTKADPKNFDGYLFLGKSYEALKRDDDAVRAYKAAIALKPEHGEANLNVGLIEHKRKGFQAAEPYLEQAAKTDYKSTKALMALADNQRMLNIFDRAIVQYGKVIGFEPNNADAYYGLGLTYIGLKNKIAASQQVRKLESLDKGLAKKLADLIER